MTDGIIDGLSGVREKDGEANLRLIVSLMDYLGYRRKMRRPIYIAQAHSIINGCN